MAGFIHKHSPKANVFCTANRTAKPQMVFVLILYFWVLHINVFLRESESTQGRQGESIKEAPRLIQHSGKSKDYRDKREKRRKPGNCTGAEGPKRVWPNAHNLVPLFFVREAHKSSGWARSTLQYTGFSPGSTSLYIPWGFWYLFITDMICGWQSLAVETERSLRPSCWMPDVLRSVRHKRKF